MDDNLKRTLLRRKFSSIEYMQEMSVWHRRAIEVLENSLDAFFERSSEQGDWHQWPASDWPETWRDRVLRNLVGTQKGIDEAIQKAIEGDNGYMEGVASEVHSIFRNLDNFSWGWWDRVSDHYREDFQSSLVKAKKRATNIMDTLSEYWRDDEILNERITGPIDEEDLKRYLKPGESIY
ncbi:hypothetical protein EDC38_2719 [Marinimicrobium koreense]|uniref:Uncharacterized protein n=1 Tax=Marinimicrobium koreense TaxID=306545 RepID=A0A3N1NIH6_9GAMM|nr:hypothetical protein [Marinimicrobium koreense]ROQ18492.1 hypothetical protein EDC38_2719 [Marinimicrobium koreense]